MATRWRWAAVALLVAVAASCVLFREATDPDPADPATSAAAKEQVVAHGETLGRAAGQALGGPLGGELGSLAGKYGGEGLIALYLAYRRLTERQRHGKYSSSNPKRTKTAPARPPASS